MTKLFQIICLICTIGGLLLSGCTNPEKQGINHLIENIRSLTDTINGEIGIAIISDSGDTLLINNDGRYPMMSVFKLHQAVAICRYAEENGISLDTIVNLKREKLDPSTWSPMLSDFSGDSISITYRDLIRYALTVSDNNASNYLFENLLDVQKVDSIICRIIPREEFRIRYSEAEMQRRHSRAFENYTSPLGAALLIEKVYNDPSLLSTQDAKFIRTCLQECKTGTDRILQPLLDEEGLLVGHKTGSGYRDNGLLAAHNDVAFVRFPNNRYYVLAVFIKNFSGTEKEASDCISRISEGVYNSLKNVVKYGS